MAGSRTVYYSWFILGVVGLDLGEYGLLGVEASMLMTTFWSARDAWHVILHGDHSWSGLDGWIDAIRAHFGDLSREHKRAPSRLWWVLAAPSIMLFVTLPLLGLSMELKPDYRKTSEAPNMTGRNKTNFNDRSQQATLAAAHSAWSLAAPPRVPAYGIVFGKQTTPSNASIFRHFSARDNTLLLSADDIFLAPQTSAPFTGEVWGMVVRYHCKIVQELDEFIILSRRNKSIPLSQPLTSYNVDDDRIDVHYQPMNSSRNINYAAVAELGYSEERYGDTFSHYQTATQCYFNRSEGATEPYPGLAKNSTLEMALWQTATDDHPLVSPPLDPDTYNLTLESGTIADLSGAYKVPSHDQKSVIPMEAIGVQCNSSSAVGTAKVNGITSRYSNFEPTDTPITQNVFQCAPRLALAVPNFIFTGDLVTGSWSEDFFTAADAPRSIFTSMLGDSVVFVLVRSTLLQAEQLGIALARAYSSTAVQLMYDGPQGYALGRVLYDGTNSTYENVTDYRPDLVLAPGVVPPALPATLLIIWAIISSYLSIRYGFLRRWTDTLDSFSMFQFGGDLADEVKIKKMPVYSFKDLRDVEQLTKLPGLVGDMRPGFSPGHITLVSRMPANEARRTKKYV